jgi:CDGSH-type Zn-finger protein/uncharacterized Fe-S cluster protein YjdI
MGSRVFEFGSAEIKALYDAKRCIHVAECVNGLPDVFNPKRRPWVDADAAPASEIAEVIRRCPTGALQMEGTGAAEQAATLGENTVAVAADGPLYLRGDIELVASDGTVLLRDTRVALCRCGASKNKPLCDGQHSRVGFRDRGEFAVESRAERAEPGRLTAKVLPNGPVSLSGSYRLCDAGGGESFQVKRSFCRCGESGSKPLCDGSHGGVGFEAD